MLNKLNLLNSIAFGARVKMNGAPYMAVMRLTDREFLAVEEGAQLPAPLVLIQADLAVEIPQDPAKEKDNDK